MNTFLVLSAVCQSKHQFISTAVSEEYYIFMDDDNDVIYPVEKDVREVERFYIFGPQLVAIMMTMMMTMMKRSDKTLHFWSPLGSRHIELRCASEPPHWHPLPRAQNPLNRNNFAIIFIILFMVMVMKVVI